MTDTSFWLALLVFALIYDYNRRKNLKRDGKQKKNHK